jgi:hypothetical protein
MTVISQQPYFSVSPMKINLNGYHFETNEVIEAETRVVLNHLTENYFQDSFKKG